MKTGNTNRRKQDAARVSVGAKKMPTVETSGRFKTKNKKHVPKITKKWDIEDFMTNMLHVQVEWYQMPDGELQHTELCRPCFEQWLNDTGRLDWCMDGYDAEGSYIQSTGTMALDDYWDNAEYSVKIKDLKDYMTATGVIM